MMWSQCNVMQVLTLGITRPSVLTHGLPHRPLITYEWNAVVPINLHTLSDS